MWDAMTLDLLFFYWSHGKFVHDPKGSDFNNLCFNYAWQLRGKTFFQNDNFTRSVECVMEFWLYTIGLRFLWILIGHTSIYPWAICILALFKSIFMRWKHIWPDIDSASIYICPLPKGNAYYKWCSLNEKFKEPTGQQPWTGRPAFPTAHRVCRLKKSCCEYVCNHLAFVSAS